MKSNITTKIWNQTIPVVKGIHLFYLKRTQTFYEGLLQRFPWTKIIFVLCCSVIVTAGTWKLTTRTLHLPRFQVSSEQMVIQNVPSWLQPYTKDITPQGLDVKMSIFDQDLTRKASQAYLKNPWVRKVVSVTKYYPNYIHAELVLRKPLAAIKQNDIYYICDNRGVRLPGEYNKETLPSSLLMVVSGVRATTPPVGQKWEGFNLLNTLPLITYLYQKDEVLKYIPILELSLHYPKNMENPQIVLLTQHETKIVWGSTLHSEVPQISADQRLNALARLIRLQVGRKMSADLKELTNIDIQYGFAIIKEKG